MARHAMGVYKAGIDCEGFYMVTFRYYVVYMNFVLGCDSLTNLKKEIRKIEKCHGVNIWSGWENGIKKDGIKAEKPVLVTHYKPKGVK